MILQADSGILQQEIRFDIAQRLDRFHGFDVCGERSLIFNGDFKKIKDITYSYSYRVR